MEEKSTHKRNCLVLLLLFHTITVWGLVFTCSLLLQESLSLECCRWDNLPISYGIWLSEWLVHIVKLFFFENKSLSAIIHSSALFACQEPVNTAILYLAHWFGVFDDVSGTCSRIIWQVPYHHSWENFHCSTGYESTLWNTSKGAWQPYQSQK